LATENISASEMALESFFNSPKAQKERNVSSQYHLPAATTDKICEYYFLFEPRSWDDPDQINFLAFLLAQLVRAIETFYPGSLDKALLKKACAHWRNSAQDHLGLMDSASVGRFQTFQVIMTLLEE